MPGPAGPAQSGAVVDQSPGQLVGGRGALQIGDRLLQELDPLVARGHLGRGTQGLPDRGGGAELAGSL
jgi:hypothetical protein